MSAMLTKTPKRAWLWAWVWIWNGMSQGIAAGCCGIREERAVDLVNDVTAGRPSYQW